MGVRPTRFVVCVVPKDANEHGRKKHGLTTWGGKAMLPRRGGFTPLKTLLPSKFSAW